MMQCAPAVAMATATMLRRCLHSCHPPRVSFRMPLPGAPKPSLFGEARFTPRCEYSEVAVEADDGSPQAGAQLEFSPVPTAVKSGSTERTKSFFPKKGQDLEMVCESLAYKGLGLCKVVDSGFVVFCERALPGERLVARIIKKRKGFAEGCGDVVS